MQIVILKLFTKFYSLFKDTPHFIIILDKYIDFKVCNFIISHIAKVDRYKMFLVFFVGNDALIILNQLQ